MTALLLTLARMTVPLVLALAVLPLLRRRSASLRAWILTSGLACAAAVPLLEFIVPAWGAPLPTGTLASAEPSSRIVVALWIAGAAVHLVLLAAGIVRLSRIAAAADPIREGTWSDLALEISAEYHVHAPVLLLEAASAPLPVTWGHAQPKVLLPASAREWSEERARIVLRHELAHVHRRDWLVHVIATVIRSIYWFHPLVWLTCSQLRLETERACDDAVLAGGISGSDYAEHLLALARRLVGLRHPAHASGLASRSTLEARVRAMLAAGIDRTVPRRWRRVAIAVLMLAISTATAGFGAAVDVVADQRPAPQRRLTLLLDGRIMDLSKEWPTYPNPRAGLVAGPGLAPELQRP